MWLRDLLPQALPNIRVMTYGYNASFKNFSGHQDLSQIAGKLLAELVDLRKTEAVRVPTGCAEPFYSRVTVANTRRRTSTGQLYLSAIA